MAANRGAQQPGRTSTSCSSPSRNDRSKQPKRTRRETIKPVIYGRRGDKSAAKAASAMIEFENDKFQFI